MPAAVLAPDCLELRLDGGIHGLSARRLWEYTELGQINPFGSTIGAQCKPADAAAFIDVVRYLDEEFCLAGFTLADLRTGRVPGNGVTRQYPVSVAAAGSIEAVAFLRLVEKHLALCSMRQATRNPHRPFLPAAQGDDVFGVPRLYSTLRRRLQAMGKTRARADHWFKTLENMHEKGLRAEELERSGLLDPLRGLQEDGACIPVGDLVKASSFEQLRLSVLPVLRDAQQQLRFGAVPSKRLKRTRKLPKAPDEVARSVVGYDPVLGYRIEQVVYSALWRWSRWAWTGGEDYKEWLITLPFYPASFFSNHFPVRNILAHIRCDLRSGADGERVLLLQEVQSDWAQIARRKLSAGEIESDGPECPPFMKEWPALALKLMLLHAAHQGLDAVAWTRGTQQAARYKGLGATGLAELYDRTLPKEGNRIVKPFGGTCEMLAVYVPTNFRIGRSENGYDVYTAGNRLLGTAPTLEDARAFLPDGAHELLYEVHGVRLPDAMRRAIVEAGFPAWG